MVSAHLLILISGLLAVPAAPESYTRQLATVVAFYEMLTHKQVPTVADFRSFFGENDESETDITLRQEFGSIESGATAGAINYVNERLNNPQRYPSRFLHCIQTVRPDLFAAPRTRRIEFPPESRQDFRRFKVWTADKVVVFEFSQDEPFIEMIYLPNGETIHTALAECNTKPNEPR